MYAIFRKARRHSLPVDIQLKLFDSLVLPILLYCCEIWGFEKFEDIEQVHLTLCKTILCVKKSTPNVMIYGELGRFSLKYKIYSRIINYWKRNIVSNEQRLSVITYKFLFSMYKNHIFISRWIVNVKNILDFAGFDYIWLRQFDSNINRKWISQMIKQCYCDMHIYMSGINSLKRHQNQLFIDYLKLNIYMSHI